MKIQNYLLIFALALLVIGAIQGNRDREKRSDAIEQLGIARSELIQAKEKEKETRKAYHEADKAYAVAQALNAGPEMTDDLLQQVQLKTKELQRRELDTIEADKALGHAESQLRRKRSLGGIIMIGSYLLFLAFLFYSHRKVEPVAVVNASAAAGKPENHLHD